MSEIKNKPRSSNPLVQNELNKIETHFESIDSSIKEMTLDKLKNVPLQETEPQTKMSSRELSNSKDIYLKPYRTVSCRDKFNEKFRARFEYSKEYVEFVAEHKELIGEIIEIWTRPYGGMHAEFWNVPTNKPVWGPRYLAEQISSKSYNVIEMQENKMSGSDGHGQYYGVLTVTTKKKRLDAYPTNTKQKSRFGEAANF